MKKQVTICCASEVMIPSGKHSKDKPYCKRCRRPVKKLKPIQSGTWARPY